MGDMTDSPAPRCYDIEQTYDWNYDHAPAPVVRDAIVVPGTWDFCGLPVASPLGVPAGPLLNGKWCLYYASLGFDVLTYKTVRSSHRDCYGLPNLQPVASNQLTGSEPQVSATADMQGSWAVSFGMPSRAPEIWRRDVEATRQQLPAGKLLVVSVVGTVQEEWSIDDLANDYARCAKWAVDSGADAVETNFSCPNVATCDGQLYQQPNAARIVAERVRAAIGSVPYIVKIGHVQSRNDAIALLAAIGSKIDALAMTNSIATVVHSGDDMLFDGQRRGICGDSIRAASIAQVKQFAALIADSGLSTKIIGVGGIGKAEHVRAYLQAGAHACHLATAAMVEPEVALQIRRSLAAQSGQVV